jgi:hypothetical protein
LANDFITKAMRGLPSALPPEVFLGPAGRLHPPCPRATASETITAVKPPQLAERACLIERYPLLFAVHRATEAFYYARPFWGESPRFSGGAV